MKATNTVYRSNNHNLYEGRRSEQYGRSLNHVRRYRANRKRLMIFCVTALIIFIGLFMFLHPKTEGIASASHQTETLYKSILVEDGMTLSSIAQEYDTNDLITHKEYIEEVKQINHINDNNIIHSGNYITIPYYVMIEE